MDDLTQKIQTILSDEESMKQLSELAAMLGLAGDRGDVLTNQGVRGDGFTNQGARGDGFTNQGVRGDGLTNQGSGGFPNQSSGGGGFAGQGSGGNAAGQGGGLAGAAGGFDSVSALSRLLGGVQSGTQTAPGDGTGGLDFAALASLASSLKGFTADDENIRFILALKPLLSPKKQARADGAVKILRLLNMLPLIKQSGLLGELLG